MRNGRPMLNRYMRNNMGIAASWCGKESLRDARESPSHGVGNGSPCGAEKSQPHCAQKRSPPFAAQQPKRSLRGVLDTKKAAHGGGFSYTRLVMVYCAALFARSSLIFSASFGTIWNRSPTIPTSATLKIGASGSLLMAMM